MRGDLAIRKHAGYDDPRPKKGPSSKERRMLLEGPGKLSNPISRPAPHVVITDMGIGAFDWPNSALGNDSKIVISLK